MPLRGVRNVRVGLGTLDPCYCCRLRTVCRVQPGEGLCTRWCGCYTDFAQVVAACSGFGATAFDSGVVSIVAFLLIVLYRNNLLKIPLHFFIDSVIFIALLSSPQLFLSSFQISSVNHIDFLVLYLLHFIFMLLSSSLFSSLSSPFSSQRASPRPAKTPSAWRGITQLDISECGETRRR